MKRGLSNNPASIWLFLVILLYAALWFIYPHEFLGSDPAAYSARAFAISQNLDFGNGDVFSQRLGITVPVAFIYALLGVDILTTNLWPLLAGLLIILTVWLSLPDNKSKGIGAALCMTSIPLFDASTNLYPDLIATAFMASSSLILFNREKLLDQQRVWLLTPVAAVLLLFIAFLAKESAYWVLPLWILAIRSDLKSEHSQTLLRKFHFPAIGAGIAVGVAYLIFCKAVWGDPLARFHAIQALTGQHLWSWEKASSHALTERLTTAPVKLLLDQYSAFILLMAFVGSVVAPERLRPWTHYLISCLLLFWFGSTSFTRYEPMPMFERMAFPLLPALYILTSFAVSRLSLSTERTKINAFIPILVVIGFSGVPFFQYVKAWQGAEVAEASAIQIVKNLIRRHPDRNYFLISSDARSPGLLPFYFGYQPPKNLRLAFAGDLNEASLQDDIKFIYVDKERSNFLKAAYGTRSYDDEIQALNLTSVYKSGDIELFITIKNDDLRKFIYSNNRAGQEKK